jgi:hypothetical protein
MPSVDQQNLKQIVKEAIQEVLVENRELVKDLLVEVAEDIALLQRIEEGRETELVSRDQVMDLLEPKR